MKTAAPVQIPRLAAYGIAGSCVPGNTVQQLSPGGERDAGDNAVAVSWKLMDRVRTAWDDPEEHRVVIFPVQNATDCLRGAF